MENSMLQRQEAEKKSEPSVGNSAMQLAKMVGNQAVVQRKLVSFNDDEYVRNQFNSMDIASKFRMIFGAAYVEVCVTRAYSEFMSKNFEHANENYVQLYQETHSAASIGYVIESIATNLLAAMDKGYEFQWVSKNGRPDVKFERNGYIGIVDITSDAQSGHVLNKDIDWESISYVAEAQYPNFSGQVSRIVPKKKFGDRDYVPSEDEEVEY